MKFRRIMPALAIAFWFGMVTFPMLMLMHPLDPLFVPVSLAKYQAFGLLTFLIVMIIFNRKGLLSSPFLKVRRFPHLLFDVVVIMIFAFSIFSRKPFISLIYATLLIVCFISVSSIWFLDNKTIVLSFKIIFISLLAFIVIAIIKYGFPIVTRMIGGIHPNHMGAVAVTIMIFGFFIKGPFQIIGILIALLVSLTVSSRYSIVIIATFLLFFYLISDYKFTVKKIFLFLIIVVLGSILSTTNVFQTVFLLTNPSRGIQTGFAGRVETWGNATKDISEKPIIGHGFRTRGAGKPGRKESHNAYLNLISEIGIFAGLAVILAFLLYILEQLRSSAKKEKTKEWVWMIRVSNSALFSILVGLFAQPQILNIGDVFGLLLFLLIGMPYYYNDYPSSCYKTQILKLQR